jgi:secondary thiamine-phosphate synthase enzyme
MAFDSFTIQTKQRICFQNITSTVQDAVSRLGINEGLCTVFIPHTTAGITINEAADPDVVYDIQMQLGKLVPIRENYKHAEGNSDAHICTSLMGSSVSIPIIKGRLTFGTWQGIFFCEFDGPRRRSVFIQVNG